MGRAEQIRGILDSMDPNAAKDALAMLLSQSVSSPGTQSVYASSSQQKGGAPGVKTIDTVDFANFAQAITYLKSKFKFKELSRFTTEADLVYVDTGDRRVLLTDRDDPARFEQPTRKPVAETYESEDEYFNNAFEPAYHKSASKKQTKNADNAAESGSANAANLEKTAEKIDNQNTNQPNTEADPFDNKRNGNSRFSSLEL